MSGAAEIQHAQIGHHQANIDIIKRAALWQARRVIADGGHEITLALHEHLAVMTGHKKAVGMGNGVAGKAPRAQHHHLRLLVSAAQGRGVGLAKTVDLGRAQHGVAAAAPDIVENAGKPHPGLVGLDEVSAARAQGVGLAQQKRLGVRHHQVGVERFHRQAGGQARDHPDAGGQHLAIATEGLRGGHDAQFSQGVVSCCVAHCNAFSVAA